MKKIVLNILILLTTFSMAVAQLIEMENKEISYDHESQEAIHLELMADSDANKKAWNDYVQNTLEKDIKGYGLFAKKDLLETDKVLIPEIDDERAVKLMAKFQEGGSNNEIYIFAEYFNGDAITQEEHPDAYNGLISIAEDYLENYLPDYYKEKYNNSQEALSDVKDDMTDIEEEIKDKKIEIEDLKQKIADLKKEQIEVAEKLEIAEKTVERRKEKVQEVSKELGNIK